MAFEIACDFDGTIFEDDFPGVGDPKLDVIKKLKEFQDAGSEVALWTCREGDRLEEAVAACKEMGLEFDSINENTPLRKKMMKESGEVYATRKIHGDIYVDDKAHGSIDHFLGIDVKATCDSFKDR